MRFNCAALESEVASKKQQSSTLPGVLEVLTMDVPDLNGPPERFSRSLARPLQQRAPGRQNLIGRTALRRDTIPKEHNGLLRRI